MGRSSASKTALNVNARSIFHFSLLKYTDVSASTATMTSADRWLGAIDNAPRLIVLFDFDWSGQSALLETRFHVVTAVYLSEIYRVKCSMRSNCSWCPDLLPILFIDKGRTERPIIAIETRAGQLTVNWCTRCPVYIDIWMNIKWPALYTHRYWGITTRFLDPSFICDTDYVMHQMAATGARVTSFSHQLRGRGQLGAPPPFTWLALQGRARFDWLIRTLLDRVHPKNANDSQCLVSKCCFLVSLKVEYHALRWNAECFDC